MKTNKIKLKKIIWYIIAIYLIVVVIMSVYNNIKWANDGTLADRYSGLSEQEIEYKKFLKEVTEEENKLYDELNIKLERVDFINIKDIEEIIDLTQKLIIFFENKLTNIEKRYFEVIGEEYLYDKSIHEMNDKNIKYYKEIKKFYTFIIDNYDDLIIENSSIYSKNETINQELIQLQNNIIGLGTDINTIIDAQNHK